MEFRETNSKNGPKMLGWQIMSLTQVNEPRLPLSLPVRKKWFYKAMKTDYFQKTNKSFLEKRRRNPRMKNDSNPKLPHKKKN